MAFHPPKPETVARHARERLEARKTGLPRAYLLALYVEAEYGDTTLPPELIERVREMAREARELGIAWPPPLEDARAIGIRTSVKKLRIVQKALDAAPAIWLVECKGGAAMDEVDTDELLRRASAGVGDKDAANALIWRVSHASWLLESRDRDALAYRIIAGPASVDALRVSRDRVRRELRALFRLHGEYKAAGFRI